jgi:hypothetical protein
MTKSLLQAECRLKALRTKSKNKLRILSQASSKISQLRQKFVILDLF